MTRFEIIKSMTPDEMSEWLCDLMCEGERRVNVDQCEMCPASHLCRPKRNGWLLYLSREPYTDRGVFKEMDGTVEHFFDVCDKAVAKLKGEA